MSRQIKRSYKAYMAWNYEKEEIMLNKRSKEGWNLIQGGCFYSKFERNEEETYRYRIDYNWNLLKDGEERKRYEEINRELGWEIINITFHGWIFLRKKLDSSPNDVYDIYTDDESFHAMIDRWIRLAYVISMLLAAIIASYILHMIWYSRFFYFIYIAVFAVLEVFILQGIHKMKKKKR